MKTPAKSTKRRKRPAAKDLPATRGKSPKGGGVLNVGARFVPQPPPISPVFSPNPPPIRPGAMPAPPPI